jgi:hypothetical protein
MNTTNVRLFNEIKEILTEAHQRRLKELEERFGITAIEPEEKQHTETKETNGNGTSRHTVYYKKAKKNEVKDVVIKAIAENFPIGQSFTTSEALRAVKIVSPTIYARLKRVGSLSACLTYIVQSTDLLEKEKHPEWGVLLWKRKS